MICLDASVFLGYVLRTDSTGYAPQVVRGLQPGEIVVPTVFWFEVRHVLCKAERLMGATVSDTMRSLKLLEFLQIDYEPLPTDRVLDVARAHRLTVYDASYLELAIRRQTQLATLDKKLADAADAVGVRFDLPNTGSNQ